MKAHFNRTTSLTLPSIVIGFVLVLASAIVSVKPAKAATGFTCNFYAAPIGTQNSPGDPKEGDGSINKPWSLQTALNKKDVITGGKTLCLRDNVNGVARPYYGTFISNLSGSSGNPVVIRSAPNEWAVIDSNIVDSITEPMTATSGYTRCQFASDKKWPNGTYVTIDDEVVQINDTYDLNTYSNALRCLRGQFGTQPTAHSIGAPIRSAQGNVLETLGAYSTFRDFEIRNSDTNRVKARSVYNLDGSYTTTYSSSRPFGIFVHSSYSKFINLVIRNTGDAFGLWSDAVNTDVYGSIVYNNGWISPLRGHGHGIYDQNKEGSRHIISDSVVFNNFFTGVQVFGSPVANLSGLKASGNLILNDGTVFTGLGGNTPKNLEFTNNYFYGEDSAINNPPPVEHNTSSQIHIDGNYGFSANSTEVITGSTRKKPAGVDIFYRPNLEESGRGLIYVYNYDPNKDTVTVSLSQFGVANGGIKSYEIYDIQNLAGGPVKTGDYTSPTVTLDMRLSTLEPIEGYNINSQTYASNRSGNQLPVLRHTTKQFNAFLVVPKGTFGKGLYRPAGNASPDTATPVFSFYTPVTDLPDTPALSSIPRYNSNDPVNFTTGTSPLTVSGYASDAAGVANVSWVNNAFDANDPRRTGTTVESIAYWQTSIPLKTGLNQITFTVTDKSGLKSSKVLKVMLGSVTNTPTFTSFKINGTDFTTHNAPPFSVKAGTPITFEWATNNTTSVSLKENNTQLSHCPTGPSGSCTITTNITGFVAARILNFLATGAAGTTPQGKTVTLNIFSSTTTPTTVTNINKPTGSFDGISEGTLFGWAKDLDNPTQPLKIHVYVKPTGQNTAPVLIQEDYTANQERPDVGKTAFNISIPNQYRDGKSYTYYVWAIDIKSDGSNGGNNVLLNPTTGRSFTFAATTAVVPSVSFTQTEYKIKKGEPVKIEYSTKNGTSATMTPNLSECTKNPNLAGQTCTFIPTANTTITLEVISSTGHKETASTLVTLILPTTNTDTTAPTVQITSPVVNGGTYTSQLATLNISGTATDNVGISQLSWTTNKGKSGTITAGNNWQANITLVSDNNTLTTNEVTVTAKDAAGNTGNTKIFVKYQSTPQTPTPTTDKIAPTITLNNPHAFGGSYTTSSAKLSMSGTAADNIGVKLITVSSNRSKVGTVTGTNSWSALIDLESGENIIKIGAIDTSGNEINGDIKVNFTGTVITNEPDTKTPGLTLNSPYTFGGPTYTSTTGKFTFGGTASDNVGVKQVWVTSNKGKTGAVTGTTSWSATIDLVPGDNIISIGASDAAGNSVVGNITVGYSDSERPSITLNTPYTFGGSYETPNARLSLSGTASDNVGLKQISITSNQGKIGVTTGTNNWSSAIDLVVGSNTIYITAIDTSGNEIVGSIIVKYIRQ